MRDTSCTHLLERFMELQWKSSIGGANIVVHKEMFLRQWFLVGIVSIFMFDKKPLVVLGGHSRCKFFVVVFTIARVDLSSHSQGRGFGTAHQCQSRCAVQPLRSLGRSGCVAKMLIPQFTTDLRQDFHGMGPMNKMVLPVSMVM